MRTAKRISISKRALQRREKVKNDFHNVIFAEIFAKIVGKKARTRFLLHEKPVLSSVTTHIYVTFASDRKASVPRVMDSNHQIM